MNNFLPVPSIDKDALTLGPAARLLYARADALGSLRYRFDEHREHSIAFGKAYGEWEWAVIDLVRMAAFFRPPSHKLYALSDYVSREPTTYLLGKNWGTVLSGDGEPVELDDPLRQISKARLPVYAGESDQTVGLRFCANPHFSELYSPECQRVLNKNYSNILEIFFRIPSGEFSGAELSLQNRRAQANFRSERLYEFPLSWHGSPVNELSAETSQRIVREEREREKEEIRRRFYANQPRGTLRRKAFARQSSGPVARTSHLPAEKAVSVIQDSPVEDRWEMIEENLKEGGPERTYLILGQFGDMLSDHLGQWPKDEVANIFSQQPAPLIAPIMAAWSAERILSVIEKHPDEEYLTEWLRDREVERLLDREVKQNVTARREAMEWLGFEDEPDSAAIKRHWRMLAGFLNTDYGRRMESSIHRRKDEVAKRLQESRDILRQEV
ncbi:MAG: hypothetical protein ACOC2L_04595 [Candidatus Sumerlaeota bacterium]